MRPARSGGDPVKRRPSRRYLQQRIAELEAETRKLAGDRDRLADHLNMAMVLLRETTQKKLNDDLAAAVAVLPGPGFQEQLRSLYVYGSGVNVPLSVWPVIGGT